MSIECSHAGYLQIFKYYTVLYWVKYKGWQNAKKRVEVCLCHFSWFHNRLWQNFDPTWSQPAIKLGEVLKKRILGGESVLWGSMRWIWCLFFFRWIWCLVTCKSQHFAARLKSRTTALLQIVILLLLGCFASSVYANYTHDSNEFWEGTSRLFYEHVFVGKFQYDPGPRKHALQLRDCEKLLPKSLTPNYLHTVTLSLLIIMLFENMKQHHRLIRWELLQTRDYPHTTVQLAHSEKIDKRSYI